MSLGDIQIKQTSNGFGDIGSEIYVVAASATLINAGEPVGKVLGTTGKAVLPLATNKPVVGTDAVAGVSMTTSTNTAGAAGTVQVMIANPRVTFLIAPNAPTSWDTQAEYDALVGARVLLDLTGGAYTILASDSANNGCVVEPLDIARYPGKVAFKFRAGCSYLA